MIHGVLDASGRMQSSSLPECLLIVFRDKASYVIILMINDFHFRLLSVRPVESSSCRCFRFCSRRVEGFVAFRVCVDPDCALKFIIQNEIAESKRGLVWCLSAHTRALCLERNFSPPAKPFFPPSFIWWLRHRPLRNAAKQLACMSWKCFHVSSHLQPYLQHFTFACV